jgi:hypothetical protein
MRMVLKRMLALGGIAALLVACPQPPCPVTEPWGRKYTVREVIAEAKASDALERKTLTVCGFLWHEDDEDSIWQDAESFDGLRACLAAPEVCNARKNAVRLTLGGNFVQWRSWRNEEGCVNGTFRTAKGSPNGQVSPLEVLVRCVKKRSDVASREACGTL